MKRGERTDSKWKLSLEMLTWIGLKQMSISMLDWDAIWLNHSENESKRFAPPAMKEI